LPQPTDHTALSAARAPVAAVEGRLVEAFFRQVQTSSAFALAIIPLVAFELVEDGLLAAAIAWGAATIGFHVARLAMSTWALRRGRAARLGAASRWFIDSSLLVTAALWGLLPLRGWLAGHGGPAADLLFSLLAFAVSTGMAIALTARPRLAIAASLLAILPGAVGFMTEARFADNALGALGLVWVGFLSVLVARLHRSLRASLELAVQNAMLLEQLRERTMDLADREAYFRNLAEASSDVVMRVAADATVGYVNPAVTAALGYAPTDIVGRRLTDFIHAEDVGPVERALTEANERMTLQVARVRRRDGGWRHLEAQWQQAGGASADALVVHFRDVTARKLAEREAELANERFFKSFSAAPVAMSITKLDGIVVHAVNDKWVRLFGIKREQVVGRSAAELDLWVEPAERQRAYDRLHRKDYVRDLAADFRAADGRIIRALCGFERTEINGEAMVVAAIVDVTPLRDSEDELRRANERFFRAFEASPIATAITFASTRVLFAVNRKWCETFGWSRAEAVGHTASDLGIWVDQDERSRVAATLDRDGEVGNLEVTLRDRAGTTIHALHSAVTIDIDGQPMLLGVTTDVSALKQAEKERRDSETRFRNLVEGSIEGIVVLDLKWKPLFANDPVAKIHRFDSAAEYLALESIVPLLDPSEVARLRGYAQARNCGEDAPTRYEFRGLRRDGSRCWIDIGVQPVRWQEQPAFLCTLIEITDRKRAEEALRASEEKFRGVVEGSLQGTAVFNSTDVLFVNRAFADIFGYTVDELRSLASLDHLVAPEDRPKIQALREARLRGDAATARYEYRGLKKDGSRVWVASMSNTIAWGGASAIQVAAIDVTARKEAEEALRQAQKLEAIGTLTGGIAHEFNNLLMVVTGNLELLRDHYRDDSFAQKRVETALRGANRGADLTRRLLAFARKQPEHRRPTDLATLARGTTEMLQQTLPHGIAVSIDAERPWTTLVDPVQAESSIVNLIVNACDAMPDGGNIAVTVRNETVTEATDGVPPGDFVMVAVSDTGIGMPPETLSHAFDPFFTTKEVGSGTGLGLSLVYGFVRQADGFVRIASEEGRGTTVSLYLPRAADRDAAGMPPPLAPAAPAGVSLRTTKCAVLVVEDDPDVRETTRAMIETLGFRTIVVPDAQSALGVIKRRTVIDVMLTDLGIAGDMNGWQLTTAAREISPGLKVVVASGDESQSAVAAAASPPLPFLHKPYNRDEVVQRIREAVGPGRLGEETR
jgi:PAS domain S-box-containing protein